MSLPPDAGVWGWRISHALSGEGVAAPATGPRSIFGEALHLCPCSTTSPRFHAVAFPYYVLVNFESVVHLPRHGQLYRSVGVGRCCSWRPLDPPHGQVQIGDCSRAVARMQRWAHTQAENWANASLAAPRSIFTHHFAADNHTLNKGNATAGPTIKAEEEVERQGRCD